jgi:nucleoside 2-deoxyribosyltransferase
MQSSYEKLVYLAGPISGTEEEQMSSWREQFKKQLKQDIFCLSPLRDTTDSTPDHPLTIEKLRHGHGSVSRDRMDVMRCDVVVANFLGARNISIGTVGEIFWADAYRKPVIVVMEDENPHFHLFILELAAWRFKTLEEAATKVNVLLSAL